MAEDISCNRSKYTLRTSDRRVFRRCLRKWNYIASMRKNLTHSGTEQNINFWFGSAIHFAMEDFHGWNRYGDPRKAFFAYYSSFKESELPPGAEAAYELGMSMLNYYLTWYPRYNAATQFETLWLDAKGEEAIPLSAGASPCIEYSFMIPLGISTIVDIETDTTYAQYIPNSENVFTAYGKLGRLTSICNNKFKCAEEGLTTEKEVEYFWFDSNEVKHSVHIIPIYYHGTMDRIVKDKFGRWWILDYKTAKGADTNKLETDDQISAYIWATSKLFKKPVYGFIYLQLTKEIVQEPRRLKNGDLSVDKKQKTTYSLLKLEIIKDYGSTDHAPNKIIQFLNDLAARETPEGDRFIRWDFIRRNAEQIEHTEKCIYGELALMLNPQLYCFPNPTRDCIWDCPVRDACIAQDRGDEDTLECFFKNWAERPRNEDGNIEEWRKALPKPEDVRDMAIEDLLQVTACLNLDFEEGTDDLGFKFLYGDDDDQV